MTDMNDDQTPGEVINETISMLRDRPTRLSPSTRDWTWASPAQSVSTLSSRDRAAHKLFQHSPLRGNGTWRLIVRRQGGYALTRVAPW